MDTLLENNVFQKLDYRFLLHNSVFVSKRGIGLKKIFIILGKKKKKNDARPFALLSGENELSLAWLELASF